MASRVTTYNTLVSALQEAAEDVGNELLDFMPVIIDNAENRLAREVETLDLVYTSTVTVNASTPTFSKPNGHKLTYHLTYIDPTTSAKSVLRKKTDDYLDEYWPNETSVGTPIYYADDDRSNFRIVPCVSTAANVKIKGVKRPTVLSSANTTNVFTSAMPDLLFHACMIEVSLWQRNQLLFQAHSQQYANALNNVNNEGRRQRRDDGTPVRNPEPGQNLLKGTE